MRAMAELPSALDQLHVLLAGLQGRRLALFLDYDGTLSPIVADPSQALLPARARAALERLAQLCPVTIVSGRGLDDVRRFVGLDGLAYAGSHGFEVVDPTGRPLEEHRGDEYLPALDRVERALRDALASVPGVEIERKRYAVAVHYRRAAPAARSSIDAAVGRAEASEASLRLGGGKMVYELRPDAPWDKGATVRWLLDELHGGEDVLPVYIGDDLTDEDAFAALDDGGIGIVVHGGDHPTHAQWSLRDTDEVAALLEALADHLQAASGAG